MMLRGINHGLMVLEGLVKDGWFKDSRFKNQVNFTVLDKNWTVFISLRRTKYFIGIRDQHRTLAMAEFQYKKEINMKEVIASLSKKAEEKLNLIQKMDEEYNKTLMDIKTAVISV